MDGKTVTSGGQFDIIPVEIGCPWYSWTRPNVHWCEENLCAYITAPANTWSNLAYLFFGILMIREARRMKSRTLLLFGPASIITGVSSFAFHASYTYAGQIFDYFGMFCFVYLAIVVNCRRLGQVRSEVRTVKERREGRSEAKTSALHIVVSNTHARIHTCFPRFTCRRGRAAFSGGLLLLARSWFQSSVPLTSRIN